MHWDVGYDRAVWVCGVYATEDAAERAIPRAARGLAGDCPSCKADHFGVVTETVRTSRVKL